MKKLEKIEELSKFLLENPSYSDEDTTENFLLPIENKINKELCGKNATGVKQVRELVKMKSLELYSQF